MTGLSGLTAHGREQATGPLALRSAARLLAGRVGAAMLGRDYARRRLPRALSAELAAGVKRGGASRLRLTLLRLTLLRLARLAAELASRLLADLRESAGGRLALLGVALRLPAWLLAGLGESPRRRLTLVGLPAELPARLLARLRELARLRLRARTGQAGVRVLLGWLSLGPLGAEL